MVIIRSSHESRITAPGSNLSIEASAVCLSSMSDRGWRVLIDFRNWPEWIPGMRDVQQVDQESPSRGTVLRLANGGSRTDCSIDHWDPPRSLSFSFEVVGGETAFGFKIQENPEESALVISLELERSITGLARPLAFFLRWRLRRLGARTITNLAVRLRPSQI